MLVQKDQRRVFKKISETFTCEHRKKEEVSLCQFAIGVLRKEKFLFHFEIYINDFKNHRLVITGHSISINLEPLTKNYYKFSFPQVNTEMSKVLLFNESICGKFQVLIFKI